MADTILPTRDTVTGVSQRSIPTPPGMTELRGMRTDRSKTHLHAERSPDGKEIRTCEVRMGAVCYRDDTGDLRSIDTTIRDLDGVIGVEWAPYKMHLHATGIGFDFWSREGGEVSIKLTGIGGEKFDQDTELKPDITDNVITFRDVRPGCDIVFKCLNQRVKTLRILHDANAPRTFEWAVASDKPELIDSTLIGTDAAGNELELIDSIDGIAVNETWTGKVKTILDPATRIRTLSSEVVYPVEIDPTVNYSISSGSDDGFESNIANTIYTWYGTSTFIRLGKAGAGSYELHPGFRFQGVAVPQGATIDSATISIKANTITGAGGSGNIFGRAADNPGVFDSSNQPLTVAKTTAVVATGVVSTTGDKTFTVTTIAQELVNRAGFASGNAMAFPIISTTSGGDDKVQFDSYETSSGTKASLSITYTAGGGVRTQSIIHNRAVHRAANW